MTIIPIADLISQLTSCQGRKGRIREALPDEEEDFVQGDNDTECTGKMGSKGGVRYYIGLEVSPEDFPVYLVAGRRYVVELDPIDDDTIRINRERQERNRLSREMGERKRTILEAEPWRRKSYFHPTRIVDGVQLGTHSSHVDWAGTEFEAPKIIDLTNLDGTKFPVNLNAIGTCDIVERPQKKGSVIHG